WLASVFSLSPAASAMLASLFCASLCAVSFYLMACGLSVSRRSACLTAILYALSSYSFVAFLFEGASTLLLMLPLVILSLHWLIKRLLAFPFALALSLAFVADIRTAWMCLMGAVIWFLFEYFGQAEKEERTPFLTLLPRLGISLAVAVLIGFAGWSLGFSQLKFTPKFSTNAKFDFLSFFLKMLPTVYDGVRVDGLPYIYFGLLPLLILPVYFLSDAIKKREKIASGLVLGFLFVSMASGLISMGFDLFGKEALPVYAQTALFGLFSLFLSARAMTLCKKGHQSPLFSAYGFLFLLLVTAQKLSIDLLSTVDGKEVVSKSYVISAQGVWITLFISTALVFLLHFFLKSSNKKASSLATVLLLAVVCFESTYAPLKLTKSLQTEYPYYSREQVNAYYQATEQAVNWLEKNQKEGYRTEMAHPLFEGENSFYGYDYISGTMSEDTEQFLSWLGFKTADATSYRGGVAPLDALLALRYFVQYTPKAEEPEEEQNTPPSSAKEEKKGTLELIKEALFPKDDFVAEFPPSEKEMPGSLSDELTQGEHYTIWENLYTLALLSSYSGDWSEVDFSLPNEDDLLYDAQTDTYTLPAEFQDRDLLYTPLDRLNAIWSVLSGSEQELFLPLTYLQGAHIFETTDSDYETDKVILGQRVYECSRPSDKNFASVSFRLSMDEEKYVVLCLPAIMGREAEVYVDDEYFATINQGNTAENAMLYLGKIADATTVDIYFAKGEEQNDFYLLQTDQNGEDIHYFYTVNDSDFTRMMDDGNWGKFDVKTAKDNTLKGTFTPAPSQTSVFTSILYHDHIKVKVDGKKVQTYPIIEGFLGFDLPDDQTHEIEIIYRNPAQPVLFTITKVVGLCGLAGLFAYEIVICTPLKEKLSRFLPQKKKS
ncbi:MAG: YfhO family protein, partial [Clostridia bacterium]|nr:YfhO family protein [Clostridia bacterium]